jgi:curved DNA-binding protein
MMASQKDYYQIMGLSRDASAKDIKMAYRRLARKYHPDLNKDPHAEEQFKAVGEAYEVLKDPEKRKMYDMGGQQEQAFHDHYTRQAGGGGYGGFQDGMGAQGFDADLFESLFGEGMRFRHTQRPHPGADRQGTLRVTLEEAYHGVVKNIHLPASSQHESKRLNVTIPAGIRSGQSIRLAGQGEAGVMGGPQGDLYLTIEVDKHPLFDVMGDDIYVTLPITPWEAALGTSIKVPTLGGLVELKIPGNSQGGQTLRLKKRGLPGKTPGDQYVLLKIMIPEPKTDSDKACYERMAREMPFNPREKWGG